MEIEMKKSLVINVVPADIHKPIETKRLQKGERVQVQEIRAIGGGHWKDFRLPDGSIVCGLPITYFKEVP